MGKWSVKKESEEIFAWKATSPDGKRPTRIVRRRVSPVEVINE